MIFRPVATEPVKKILSTSASQSAAPVEPSPWITSTTPRGRPMRRKISSMISPVIGVTSEGLSTTVLPAMSALSVGNIESWKGKFHGAITAITPIGNAST